MEEILAMEHITKTYPGVKALDDVSISFIQGEVHAVMGENGAGKSTLMKILNGMIPADGGEIRFHGEKVAIRNPRDARALGIAMIHQELNPIKDLTVAENMFVGRYPQKGCFVDWSTMYDECRKLFEHWKVDFDPKQKVRTLSTAETQMLEILKAISYDAKLIIMDEPTSAITEREVQKLFSFIEELKGKGITIIIITHKIDEVFHVADRVSVLNYFANPCSSNHNRFNVNMCKFFFTVFAEHVSILLHLLCMRQFWCQLFSVVKITKRSVWNGHQRIG